MLLPPSSFTEEGDANSKTRAQAPGFFYALDSFGLGLSLRTRSWEKALVVRGAAFGGPGAGAFAAGPVAFAEVARQTAGAGGALAAGAHDHRDGAGRLDLAIDGDRSDAAGIGERAVLDADRIAITAVAVALFGDDGDAPQAVISRHCVGAGRGDGR